MEFVNDKNRNNKHNNDDNDNNEHNDNNDTFPSLDDISDDDDDDDEDEDDDEDNENGNLLTRCKLNAEELMKMRHSNNTLYQQLRWYDNNETCMTAIIMINIMMI